VTLRNEKGNSLQHPCGKWYDPTQFCDKENYLSWRRVAIALRGDVINGFGTIKQAKREGMRQWLLDWGNPEGSLAKKSMQITELLTRSNPVDVNATFPEDPGILDIDWVGIPFATLNEDLAKYISRGYFLAQGAKVKFGDVIELAEAEPDDDDDNGRKGAAPVTTALAIIGGVGLLGGALWVGLQFYSASRPQRS
jgi:hypothetical protein